MKFMARTAAISAVVLLAACGGGGSSGGSTAPPVQAPAPTPTPTTPTPKGPNVVFIVADDLNLYVEGYEGHPQAYTPNLKRLMARGVTFRNAQANAGLCSPSRASFLSGYMPVTSGKVFTQLDFRAVPRLAHAKLIPEHFRDQGYAVYGAGKVMHERDDTVWGTSDPVTQPKSSNGAEGGYVGPFHSFGPYPWDGVTRKYGRAANEIPFGQEGVDWTRTDLNRTVALLPGSRWNNNPNLPIAIQDHRFGFGRLSDAPVFAATMNSSYPAGWSYAGFADYEQNILQFRFSPLGRDRLADERIADWASKLIRGNANFDADLAGTAPIAGRSFMLMMGLTKTHSSLYIPDEFFDAYIAAEGIQTINDVALPPAMRGALESNDLDDIPYSLQPRYAAASYQTILRGGDEGGTIPDLVHRGKTISNTRNTLVRSMILNYLVAVYMIDVQLGKILDAIDADPALRDNTIIVFTSDNGVHQGEKMSWFKDTMYNPSFGVPLVIADPRARFAGTRGQVSYVPVSLVDLYPTLVELAGLPDVPIVAGSPPLDGVSLVPALLNPQAPSFPRPTVAMGTNWGGHGDDQPRDPSKYGYTLRTERYRYNLSAKGEEDMYDIQKDPYEITNVSNDPAYASAKAELNAIVHQRAGF